MEKLFKFGNSIYSILMLFWLYFTIYYLFEFLNIDFTNLKSAQAKLLLSIFFVGISIVHFKQFRKKIIQLFSSFYIFVITHKLSVMLALFIFQIVILLTSIGLAKADTTVLYNIATNPNVASETDYISYYPNNFMLLVWMKVNFFLFGKSAVVAMGFFNILFIDSTIYLLYKLNSYLLTKNISNNTFILSILILGMSPQYIYTYSDSITLWLLSIFLLYISKIVRTRDYKYAILSGILLALTYSFRPTVMIFVIAGVIVTIAKMNWTKLVNLSTVKVLLVGLLAFVLVNRSIDYTLEHQKFVKYEPNYSRSLLYFVDLGLTYSGNVHAEIPVEVATAIGPDRNKLALEDIKKRLSSYNRTTFIGHLFYKYYWITNEGMFGWLQERVLSEAERLETPWIRKVQDTSFAKWIRTYVYAEGENYYLYATFMQVVWIIIAFGLLAYSFYFTMENSYQLWMQISLFGGIMFLMIFEGGRTRYLIQFLPAIVSIASYGLSTKLNKCILLRELLENGY
ncbi:hypothetical protein [Streptococcus hyovaginalis]|uniref:hypothetical protein n=1 Tax=Streptococcus hyovaginalis TaxID=149015 RepID=UPI002A7FAA1C|nr:hypothetical protein [Streptococcus hyovaginalis]